MPADPSVPVPAAETRWQCDIAAHDDEPRRLVVVQSSQYADGARVQLAGSSARSAIADRGWCVVTYAEDRIVAVSPTALAAPKAPPLWFAELRESGARPPAVNLLAFTGHGRAAGVLLDAGQLTNVDVTTVDQLGALRWYPATGEVDQLYVQPDWRRRSIAGALIAAAGGLTLARDWPRLWTDGQRTAMGEALRNSSTWRHRAEPLTHLAPPMTPVDPLGSRRTQRT